MATFKISYIVGLAFLHCICNGGVFAEKVVLDLHSNSDTKWLDITCLYNEDYNDFWVFGYPVTLTGDDDKYPEYKGFWTPGGATKCEMHYYGGQEMPTAKSVTVSMYVRGKPEILVSSKYGLLDEAYDQEIGQIPQGDKVGWIEETIDLTKFSRARIFNFTLIGMGDDVLFVDKIVFDLGDETTTPAEPPPPTTGRPITGDETVILDSNKDYWVIWEEDCIYMDDYAYYWAYGCPAEVGVETREIGYWNPCNVTRSCRLRFKADSTLLPQTPRELSIRSYITGGAKINVTLQGNQDDAVCGANCRFLQTITSSGDDGWVETSIKQDWITRAYTFNFELIPSEDGVVLLDKVTLQQGTPLEETTPEGGNETTPSGGGDETTPSGGGDETSPGGDDGGGNGDSAGVTTTGWRILTLLTTISVLILFWAQ